jgi:hypothetical protein
MAAGSKRACAPMTREHIGEARVALQTVRAAALDPDLAPVMAAPARKYEAEGGIALDEHAAGER